MLYAGVALIAIFICESGLAPRQPSFYQIGRLLLHTSLNQNFQCIVRSSPKVPSLQGGVGSNSVNSVHHLRRWIARLERGESAEYLLNQWSTVVSSDRRNVEAARSVVDQLTSSQQVHRPTDTG